MERWGVQELGYDRPGGDPDGFYADPEDLVASEEVFVSSITLLKSSLILRG